MPIRIATVILFLAAVVLAVSAPIPDELPAVALGQAAVYRVEVLLALVYGGLLLLTPLFRGVGHGQLPVEISHRGAKWPPPAEEAVARLEEEIVEMKAERIMLKSKHFYEDAE